MTDHSDRLGEGDPPSILTPHRLMALRITNKGLPLRDNEGAPSGPYITTSLWPGEGEWFLHSGGFTVAKALHGETILALLRCERIEPGWCSRVLASSEPIDEAFLPPDARSRLASQRAAHDAQTRLYKESADAEAARRRSHFRPADVSTIGLDQLMDPGFSPYAPRKP